ncbi:hypothetical protein TWF106_007087 [Orbilia oligospora]|uniref:Uncharacterized protein n=2 Tax=Orbilia oligospora TaxID=2813651 RepID=A0A7C8QMB0_ORBOL|nr:hypothetical protein TWF788_003776 [Orbilia oligospora]KAF3219244.1 hypothetical protein TWF106_007087 [Orbilia oligospora]
MSVSRYPYTGHKHASGQILHIWILSDVQDPSIVPDLFELILKGPASRLQTALNGVAYGGEPGYDDAELWLMATWHTSASDNKEHCTFRLFRGISSGKPQNDESYHLYRDGSSRSWIH